MVFINFVNKVISGPVQYSTLASAKTAAKTISNMQCLHPKYKISRLIFHFKSACTSESISVGSSCTETECSRFFPKYFVGCSKLKAAVFKRYHFTFTTKRL